MHDKSDLNEEIIKLIHEEHQFLEQYHSALDSSDDEKSHYYFQKSVEKKKAYRKLLWGCEEPTFEEMTKIKINNQERKITMLNKYELEKIVINSAEELKQFEGQDLTGKYFVMKTVVKNVKLGTLEGCVIEGGGIVCEKMSRCNLYDVSYTYADEIYLSVLQRCKKVKCGGTEDNYNIKASQFFGCGEVTIDDATVEDCIFDGFEIMFPTSTTMDNCIISNIICENDCAISMEDGNFTNISFENIELRNGAYLIEGYGNPWVENSVFMNIRTSREDYEIFHMEETIGKIFKKKVEFSFVDEESCSGLELIPILSGIKPEGGENE